MATIIQSTHIQKRNGEVVNFEPEKITRAMEKAFQAVRGGADREVLRDLTSQVIELVVREFGEATPTVEGVQDIVERTIMQAGAFDVAKAYIVYRFEHTKVREEHRRELIERQELMIIKSAGHEEPFSLQKLEQAIRHAAWGLEDQIDIPAILKLCELSVTDGMQSKEVGRALIMATRSFVEVDPAYSKLAARLLIRRSCRVAGKGVFDFANYDEEYRRLFKENLQHAIQVGKLDPRMAEFDLEKISQAIKSERDELLWYLGVQTLADRYLLQEPETSRPLETPQAFWMRVAMGMAIAEADREARAIEFYEVISQLRYVPSTPTLFHSGTKSPQLSSCYLNTVADDLTNIFKVYGDNAQLSKWSGGIGTDWSYLRGTNAMIKKVGVESQGVIPFLKIANDTTAAINRSGRRRGAACVYLECWHIDYEDFMELRKNTGDERRRCHDMNTASWIPDLFMKRVREDGQWTFFSPDETPDLHDLYGRAFEKRYTEYEQAAAEGKIRLTRTTRARDLWKKMLGMLFETGHPWITFKDPANVRSPQDHAGVIHNSNLCSEITLNTSTEETAVCNLGSVNLVNHIREGRLDENLLRETVETAVRMLDNVIDINFYPTVEAKTSNLRHRPIGLGVMGTQDAFYQLGISFDSEEAVNFADESMELVSYYAIAASAKLATERGTYESYRGSKWDRGYFPLDTLDLLEEERGIAIDVPRTERLNWDELKQYVKITGMRNSNCLAIAPTATISNISGCVPSIEPIYKNLYVKSNVSGDFTVLNRYLVEDLKCLGLWSQEMLEKIKFRGGSVQEIQEIPQLIREKYKETFEIDPRWLIRAAAVRGKWIDQSQSLNVFFHGTSGKELSDIYMYAWELGLKTTYYLRTLAASQVEKSTLDTAVHGATHTRKVSAAPEAMVTPSVSVKPATPAPPPARKAVTAPQPALAASATVVMVNGASKKICSIIDPTCESCQ